MARLACIAFLLFVAAGCGGAARRDSVPRVPRALAANWAGRADAVAAAAASGESCRAKTLASSLRDDVIARESDVPLRLRTTLIRSVAALADRISCIPAPPQHPHPHPPHPKQPKPPKPPKHGDGQGDQG